MAAGAVVAHPADKYANATQPWMRYQPRVDTLTAYKPTMTQRIPDMVKDGLRALGLNKFAANAFGSPIADVLGYSPVGAVAQSWDAGQAAAGQRGMLGKVAGLGGGMALAALGAVPGGKALRGAVNDAERGIVAYHGSPHTFDKFSLDKIGTGEGAQAYGHGLYFAENEGVAKSYRDALTPLVDPSDIEIGGRNIIDHFADTDKLPDAKRQIARDALMEFRSDLIQNRTPEWMAREYKYAATKSQSPTRRAMGREMLKLVGNEARVVDAAVPRNNGSMYQVRINADPADFLDWDKPLAEQSDKVRAALAGTAPRNPLYESFDPNRIVHEPEMSGRAIYDRIKIGEGGSDAALNPLRDAGVAGIKYLDAGSRGAGDGSRNFVVFNDKLIDILKRYGWVPGTAIPAGLMANAQLLTGEGIPRETQY